MTDRPGATHRDQEIGPAHEAAAGPHDIGGNEDTEGTEGTPEAPEALRSVRGESVAAAVGSFMAGIEQQVFQRRPPAIELVQQSQPVRGVSGDGLEITISLPEPDLPER